MLRGIVLAIAIVCGWYARGAELPSRVYTTEDGLARDDVYRIRRDSRGYLWFGTAEGLSVFDGYRFTNYTTADGLPNRAISDILETRSGEYWIATSGGLCHFDPAALPGHRFTPVRTANSPLAAVVNVLFERRDGSIWFGTEEGLWRLERSGQAYLPRREALPSPAPDGQRVFAMSEDREGILWIGASDGLYALPPNESPRRFGKQDGLPNDFTVALLADRQGRLWVSTGEGVCLVGFPRQGRALIRRAYRNRGLTNETATSLLQTGDGKLWVTGWGLFEFTADAPSDRPAFRRVLAPFGGNLLTEVAEDADRNLWVGGAGAVKITRHGFTRFSLADGLRASRMHSLIEDVEGHVCAIAAWNGLIIHCFDGTRFTAVSSYLPPHFLYAWGDSQISFQDRAGEWWVPTQNGLLRFARPERIQDLASSRPTIYSRADGLPSNIVLRLFEDSREDVWIGVYKGLAKWSRATGRISAFSSADGLPYVTANPPELPTPNAIAEDRAGQVWVGFHPYGLARMRSGHFDFFTEADGLPKGQINGVYCDETGRLWIASSQGGLARIDDPTALRPSFRVYTTAEGLSSNQVYHTVEDRFHRIYATVGRGVDRLDPDTGSVRHFTTADGVPPLPQYALKDREGALWFASAYGLSRYQPEPDNTSAPGTPLILAVRVAGRPVSVSALGETHITGLRLAHTQNNLQIEFGALHFASGEVLRYQYRLDGADSNWSPANELRIVNFASLTPGVYRFVVRAINGEGRVSKGVASLEFVIAAPVWRRGWFVSLALVLTTGLLYSAYRYRLAQAVRVERIRTRLASDLHDDIGAGLVDIAILSEVAETARNGSAVEILEKIGDRARQLRDAMSDIVWSVDPRHDSLSGLVSRLRQIVYSTPDIEGRTIEFNAPEEREMARVSLAPDRARHVLLIVKEALTNISKHAHATQVFVRIAVDRHSVVLEISDNGRGFDPQAPVPGMGLRNVRRRAAECRGQLCIDSAPRSGTRLLLTLSLAHSDGNRGRTSM